MVTPTGGAKDIVEPKPKSSTPANGSANFKGKEIEIQFNEYIVLKEVQNQFIISPSQQEPTITKKNKSLNIKFEEPLQNDKTYILNFGNSISDYTENNVLKDYKFIFSTGPQIDTLTLKGKVIDAFSTEGLKDILICLYADTSSDSAFYLSKPNYTVRSKDSGLYTFTNLQQGKYKLFALRETNNNKRYDSGDESIAFADSIVQLDSSATQTTLKLFREIPATLRVVNKDIYYQKVNLQLNKKFEQIDIASTLQNIDTIIQSTNKDSISIYFNTRTDTNKLIISTSNWKDTIDVKFPKSLKKQAFTTIINPVIQNDTVSIYTTDLATITNADSIILMEDSNARTFRINQSSFNTFQIIYPFNQKSTYTLSLLDSAICDYQGQKNKKISQKLEFYNPENFGTLRLTIDPIYSNKIIELLNDKSQVVRRVDNYNNVIYFTNLAPSTYRIRVIDDTNKNKRWDTGNFSKKIQPEEVKYQLTTIKIRANWDAEIILQP